MDMEEFVKKNMEKAKEKEEKKRAKTRKKKGHVSAGTLINAANTNAKVIETKNSNSLAAKANMNVNQDVKTDITAHPNSLAAKASMVSQFNEEQGEVIEDIEVVQARAKRKYKK